MWKTGLGPDKEEKEDIDKKQASVIRTYILQGMKIDSLQGNKPFTVEYFKIKNQPLSLPNLSLLHEGELQQHLNIL